MNKTVVVVYIDKAASFLARLQGSIEAGSQTINIDEQFQHLIKKSLNQIECSVDCLFECKDASAALIFAHASQADHFGEALFDVTETEYKSRFETEKDWPFFGIGIASSQLTQQRNKARSIDLSLVKFLSNLAQGGEIVAETTCWAKMPQNVRKAYSSDKIVHWQNVDGTATISVRRRRVVKRKEPQWIWKWLDKIAIIFAILGVGVLSDFHWLFPHQPFSVDVHDQHIEVKSKNGDSLWSQNVSGTIKTALVDDLEGNGKNEVIVGVGNGGDDTGKILVYNAVGKLLYSCDTSQRAPYRNQYSGRYTVVALETADIFRSGKKQLIALSVESQGWLNSLATIFDYNGKLLNVYWNPGHLTHLAIGSESLSAQKKVIISGINNQFSNGTNYRYCVFLLDPKTMPHIGQAPLFPGQMGQGDSWYGMLCPLGIGVDSLSMVERNRSGIYDIAVYTGNHYILYLNFLGIPVGQARPDDAVGNAEFFLYKGQTNLCDKY